MLLLWIFIFVAPALGQEADFEVTGQVTDARTGDVLPGTNVVVQGTNIGTTTDGQGGYQLSVPSRTDTLVFSFVGYNEKAVPIDGRSVVDVELVPAVGQLEDLVVVGYGEQRVERVTGSVSSVDPASYADQPVTDVTQALQGRVSGVEIVRNGGSPARDAAIRIRGTGTVNNSNPLIVVNGFPVGNDTGVLNDLDPNSIESIEVLKDAAAAAVYGNRAANGVVLVTTKDGSFDQELSVTFRTTAGLTTPRKTIDVLEAPELTELKVERFENDGLPVAPIWQVDSLQTQRTDWQEALLDSGNGGFQNYSLSIQGGNETSTFFLSGNYTSEEGMIKEAFFDRLGIQVNSSHRIDDFLGLGRLTITQNLTAARVRSNTLNTLSAQSGVYFSAIRFHPGLPVRWSNGEYSSSQISGEFGDINNPMFTVNEAENERTMKNKLIGNVRTEYQLLDNLSLRVNTGIDYQTNELFNFDIIIDNQIRQQSRNSLDRNFSENYSFLTEAFLNYNQTLGSHEIDLLGGYSRQTFEGESFAAQRSDFQSEAPSQRVLDAGQTITGANGSQFDDGLLSGISRLNYAFSEKYLLTASLRADGSSRFSEDNRWGYFPAVSVGWRLGEEDFFQDWLPVFSSLKLSGGWGQSGNQSVARLQYLGLFSQESRVYLGGQRLTGVNLSRFPNTDITWETVESSNVGLEMGFADDRLQVDLELWRKDTEDMLLAPPSVGSAGTTELPDVNVGAVRNQGVDVQVSYERSFRDLDVRLSGNASFLQNEVLNINENFLASRRYGRPNVELARTFEGHPIATFYGWRADGLYQTQEEISNDPALANDPRRDNIRPGDVRFLDLNGDGRIDAEDRMILGSPHPDVTYGFNVNGQYRNFDLTLFFNGSAGSQIFNGDRMQGLNPTYPFNLYEEAMNRWRGEGTSNTIPRMTTRRTNRNFRSSDKWIESGNFLRLKTLTLGYSAPGSFLDVVNLDNLRLHATIQNVFTITPYSGLDPELGYTDGNLQRNVDFAQYPQGRTWTIGSVISF
jgi:TonB-linked SusC/RagA family outer membrane protein